MDWLQRRYIPNAITIARLLLVLPIAFAILGEQYLLALVLFTVSGASDGLDGFLARRFDWESTFGRLIDPLADKLMMITTTLTLGMLGHFPLMLMVLIIVKDVAILGGVFSYTSLAGFPSIQPNRLGKVTTACQIVLLVSVLLGLCFPALLAEICYDVWFWLVAVMTVLDGILYLWVWTARLARDPRWKESFQEPR
jgi:cardiolipin synthase